MLQEVCESILSARDKGLLLTEQDRRYAIHADMLMRGFARVGIIALVDEATGYQRDRAKDALAKILEEGAFTSPAYPGCWVSKASRPACHWTSA